MEFNFNIEKLLGPATKQGIVFLSGEDDQMNNQFQSGMVSGLKYSIMALEGHNIEEAYGLIVGKYNEVSKPQKKYWP